ncbi:MAG: AAA family ATPase, partial [Micrococcales bacterium]|nr:AAA family ATPase [Micrococcales bacterium]
MTRLTADGQGIVAAGQLDAMAYQSWVDFEGRGMPRENSVRFAEMVLNVPKSLSLAALDPAVSDALDAALDRAAKEAVAYWGRNSVTRIGPRGGQRVVPAEQIEAAYAAHATSRAGDPHRHLHLQLSSRVWAEGQWHGLWTGPTFNQQEAVRRLVEASIYNDVELRQAIAGAGLHIDTQGQVVELEPFASQFSKRAAQVESNLDAIEAAWRVENPGQLPGPALRLHWHQQAWDQGRAHKVHETNAEDRWRAELASYGFVWPARSTYVNTYLLTISAQDFLARHPELAVQAVNQVMEFRSAWSRPDLEAAALAQITGALDADQVVLEPGTLAQVAGQITADAEAGCVPMLADVRQQATALGASVRCLTSGAVVAEDQRLRDLFAALASQPETPLPSYQGNKLSGLDDGQREAVQAIAGGAGLVVIEGAAGAGKTTMLSQVKALADQAGRSCVIVAPTLKAARVAGRETGADSSTAHRLAYLAGFRCETGIWSRENGSDRTSTLKNGSVLVIDEAGMADRGLLLALATIAEESGSQLVLVGDRQQLAAVGRGGGMALAARYTTPVYMDELHRFTDPAWADLTLQLRQREPGAAQALLDSGAVVPHTSIEDAQAEIAARIIDGLDIHTPGLAVVATNAQAHQINQAVQAELAARAKVDLAAVPSAPGVCDGQPEALHVGDRVQTRLNDSRLGVANRDIWTVTRIDQDRRTMEARADDGHRVSLPFDYTAENVQLAWASTAHGVQGETTNGHADVLLTDATDAAGLYVACTRATSSTSVHIVADSPQEALEAIEDALRRDRADQGLEAAQQAAQAAVDAIAPTPVYDPIPAALDAAQAFLDTYTLAGIQRLQANGDARTDLQDAFGACVMHDQSGDLLQALQDRWQGGDLYRLIRELDQIEQQATPADIVSAAIAGPASQHLGTVRRDPYPAPVQAPTQGP